MKAKITNAFLLKEYRSTTKVFLFSIFVIAGLFCFICPMFYCKGIRNLLTNMAFMLVIAIPFCGIGIKNILNIVNQNKHIKKSNYLIIADVVVNKRMLQHGTSKNTSDSYCQLDFEKHSKETGKSVVVKRTVYNETQKGDLFYLVYVNKKLLAFYPASRYELP
mgnify:CR=1 FL=1